MKTERVGVMYYVLCWYYSRASPLLDWNLSDFLFIAHKQTSVSL